MAVRPMERRVLATYLLRQAAFAIMVTVTIFIIGPLWAIVNEPSILARDWNTWGWFIVIPYSVVFMTLFLARRLRKTVTGPDAR